MGSLLFCSSAEGWALRYSFALHVLQQVPYVEPWYRMHAACPMDQVWSCQQAQTRERVTCTHGFLF